MKKLASVIDEIVKVSTDANKNSNNLSNTNSSPTISTTVGKALLKTAELLKQAESEVTYSDIADYVKGLKP